MRNTVFSLFLLVLTSAAASAESSWEVVHGDAFDFTVVGDGIYHAVGKGSVSAGSNSAILVNDRDVLLVDSHMTPAAARALLADLKKLTDKPVREVVNTHFHFDHVDGNQVFGPEVEILGHEFTREKIVSGGSVSGRGWNSFIAPLPDRIAALEKQLASAPAERRGELEQQLAGMRRLWGEIEEVEPTPPTLTLHDAVTLYRGAREIRILFFGRGHTGGDLVVYLPQEKVLVSGDLVTAGIPYMGDAYFADWPVTLQALQALDVRVVLPGHGGAFTDVERIGHLAAYLRDLWQKIQDLHAKGVPAEEAAKQIDMTAHAADFPQIQGPGVSADAVARGYALLEGSEE